MKKNKLLLLSILLMTSCQQDYVCVSSTITHKWDRYWIQPIHTGQSIMYFPHYDYYFQFNELKPYTKKVLLSDYEKFEIGDIYTFTISEEEKECFFSDSIYEIQKEEQ